MLVDDTVDSTIELDMLSISLFIDLRDFLSLKSETSEIISLSLFLVRDISHCIRNLTAFSSW